MRGCWVVKEVLSLILVLIVCVGMAGCVGTPKDIDFKSIYDEGNRKTISLDEEKHSIDKKLGTPIYDRELDIYVYGKGVQVKYKEGEVSRIIIQFEDYLEKGVTSLIDVNTFSILDFTPQTTELEYSSISHIYVPPIENPLSTIDEQLQRTKDAAVKLDEIEQWGGVTDETRELRRELTESLEDLESLRKTAELLLKTNTYNRYFDSQGVECSADRASFCSSVVFSDGECVSIELFVSN